MSNAHSIDSVATHSRDDVMVHCENVWKVFGSGAERLIGERGDAVTDEELARHELITAVREVSLSVIRGEIFVIMGLSGSGKSTLVRCMTGLIPPTLGRLLVDGTDLMNISPRDLVDIRRYKMGMVFQDFALLPHLTVLGNVAFPLKIQGIDRSAREARARDMIELVGLSGRERYYPHELSGGQQQRVGIARSLTTEPQIWFLDEPFSALDPLIRHEMQGELQRLQALLQKTIVFITHDFDEAIKLADRIAIMNEGRVVQIGSPEELVVNPADEYVAEFTDKIPRARVLTVGAVMGSPNGEQGEPVNDSSLVHDVAERVLAAERAVPVKDSAGVLVGSLDRDAVTRVLLDKDRHA
ncbi:MAG: ABC transporter ATP-binding protein [Thiotrichales bacterium]|nr:ABC transporter ATP-binding protein [Thiotrichales bacterium]